MATEARVTGCLLLVALIPATAAAIPPFARRYGMTCSTCHVGGPTKLSTFGEAFRDNGYRIPGNDADFVREEPLPLGDPARAALFPRTVWPGQLPATVPIGVSGLFGVVGAIPPPSSGERSSAALDAIATLHVGAPLTKHLALFGGASIGTSGIALGQLFVVARSLFERWLGEGALHLKVGRFIPDLFAVQPNLQRSSLVALPAALPVGRDGFELGAPAEAIELYGLLGGRLKWVAGVANGRKPLDDVSTRRDLFGRLALKIGGPRLDYRGSAPSGDDDISLLLGAAIYWGVGVVVPPPPEVRFRSEIGRVMADVRLRVRGFDVLGQVALGSDSDPDGLARSLRHVAWAGGVDAAIFPWFQLFARFEEARFDDASRPERRRVVVGSTLFIRANVRLQVESAVGLVTDEQHLLIARLFAAL